MGAPALRPRRQAGRDSLSRLDSLPARELPGGRRVLEARGLRTRALGLAWLRALPPGTALHIPRCRSVHTFGMRFDLDLVWLDQAGRPVRIDRAVPPARVRTCAAARSVLETAAGAADRFL